MAIPRTPQKTEPKNNRGVNTILEDQDPRRSIRQPQHERSPTPDLSDTNQFPMLGSSPTATRQSSEVPGTVTASTATTDAPASSLSSPLPTPPPSLPRPPPPPHLRPLPSPPSFPSSPSLIAPDEDTDDLEHQQSDTRETSATNDKADDPLELVPSSDQEAKSSDKDAANESTEDVTEPPAELEDAESRASSTGATSSNNVYTDAQSQLLEPEHSTSDLNSQDDSLTESQETPRARNPAASLLLGPVLGAHSSGSTTSTITRCRCTSPLSCVLCRGTGWIQTCPRCQGFAWISYTPQAGSGFDAAAPLSRRRYVGIIGEGRPVLSTETHRSSAPAASRGTGSQSRHSAVGPGDESAGDEAEVPEEFHDTFAVRMRKQLMGVQVQRQRTERGSRDSEREAGKLVCAVGYIRNPYKQ